MGARFETSMSDIRETLKGLRRQDLIEIVDTPRPYQCIRIESTERDTCQTMSNIVDSVLTVDDRQKYCRPWSKLTQNSKIGRVSEFVDSLQGQVDDSHLNSLRYLLVSMVGQKTLNGRKVTQYDSTNGIILSIAGLDYDPDEGYFPSDGGKIVRGDK